MKLYLKSIIKQLSNYSSTLDKTSILFDKPWALIDDDFEMQKLIFKKNKELILSKNGQAQIGKWDYFPEAKSLLIDRNYDKILCNESFIDKGVMILRLDGTENKFFILANENIVPDLDANSYLKKLRYQKLNIEERKLLDGRILEVSTFGGRYIPQIGDPVTVNAEIIDDGIYQLDNNFHFYEVKNSKICKIITETSYCNPDNCSITIHQQNYYKITKGDIVFLNNNLVDNATINFSKAKNIIVRDGKLVRLERKNVITKWLSEFYKEIFDINYD